jgi:hypothetical protein
MVKLRNCCPLVMATARVACGAARHTTSMTTVRSSIAAGTGSMSKYVGIVIGDFEQLSANDTTPTRTLRHAGSAKPYFYTPSVHVALPSHLSDVTTTTPLHFTS